MDLQSMFKDNLAAYNTDRKVLTRQMNYLNTRLS